MTLRHMNIFHALCENDCNTTKTAEALNMTQPAVSQAIKEMEQYYGIVLFDRVGRKLVLTKAGELLHGYAAHISALFNEVETELKSIDKYGNVSVGATLTIGSLFLPRYVKIFKDSNPQINVKGLVAPTNILENKILDYEIDLALIEGIAHSPSIVSEPYMDDELCLATMPGGKFESEQTISIDEFKKEKVLVREKGSGTREIFERATEKAGFSMVPEWEAISTSAIINAAISGLGIAVLPYRTVYPYIKYGALIKINVEGLDLKRKFFVIHHKDKCLSSSAKAFLKSCLNCETEYPCPSYVDIELQQKSFR